MEEASASLLWSFQEDGRGILFGHDTLIKPSKTFLETNKYLEPFAKKLGITFGNNYNENGNQNSAWTSATTIQLINNGYLMKYPFEMKEDVTLEIPLSHNIEIQKKDVGTTWFEFRNPSGPYANPIYNDEAYRGGWYLKTNENIAMIQTGHSNGASTLDERKIIANVLYNLAQISLESKVDDFTVSDTVSPNAPRLKMAGDGTFNNITIDIDSEDHGKSYQWYAEASTKDQGILKSDVIEEEIKSNIAGYFYRITPAKDAEAFIKEIESLKNEYGRIPEEKYDIYVAPSDTDLVDYSTDAQITIDGKDLEWENIDTGFSQELYVGVASVDRSNNISEVTYEPISKFMTEIRVTERYVNKSNHEIKPRSYQIMRKEDTYSKEFPKIINWFEYG